MKSPMDFNQHLLAYLQAWRQLLETSAAMTSGWPFPPGMPGMPGMPPMPPGMPMPPSAAHAAHAADDATGLRRRCGEPADRLCAAAVQLPAGVAAVPSRRSAQHRAPCRRRPDIQGPAHSRRIRHRQARSPMAQARSRRPRRERDRVFLRPRDPIGTITDLKSLSGLESLRGRPEVTGPTVSDSGSGSGGSAFAAKIASAGPPHRLHHHQVRRGRFLRSQSEHTRARGF